MFGWPVDPKVERLLEGLIAFLADDDDGPEAELLEEGEEWAVRIESIGDDDVDPAEGLLDTFSAGLTGIHSRRSW